MSIPTPIPGTLVPKPSAINAFFCRYRGNPTTRHTMLVACNHTARPGLEPIGLSLPSTSPSSRKCCCRRSCYRFRRRHHLRSKSVIEIDVPPSDDALLMRLDLISHDYRYTEA